MGTQSEPETARSYIPKVKEDDVVRIIARDFPVEIRPRVLQLLAQCDSPPCKGIETRTKLSILKLSDGDFDLLGKHLKVALFDFRDVVGVAESPRFFKLGFSGFRELDEDHKEEVQRVDLSDYENWLTR